MGGNEMLISGLIAGLTAKALLSQAITATVVTAVSTATAVATKTVIAGKEDKRSNDERYWAYRAGAKFER